MPLGSLLKIMVFTLSWGVSAHATVQLPIEVMGPTGTSSTVTVTVPSVAPVTSLWMKVHGTSYAGKMSVSINGGAFTSLSNSTMGLTIADPERSYGGIGSNYAVIEMTLALPANSVPVGTNTITFQFNGTDGNSDGFRVLEFNFLDGTGTSVLPPSTFTYDDPNTWTAPAPLNTPSDIAAGKVLYQTATLIQSPLSGAPTLTAHCADCHTLDGHDLKYFNYSNLSIMARAKFHGLTDAQANQIASYIRSLTFVNPGRPWNPPYQPATNIDTLPVSSWAAGGGLDALLPRDSAALNYVFPQRHLAQRQFDQHLADPQHADDADGISAPRLEPLAAPHPPQGRAHRRRLGHELHQLQRQSLLQRGGDRHRRHHHAELRRLYLHQQLGRA